MSSATQAVPVSNKMLWAGRILSALPVLALVFSGSLKLMKPAAVLQGFAHLGYQESVILGIGIAEIACALVYAFPRTAVLGAILMTGFLGGATATHVRVGEPFFMPILVAVVAWAGLFLREGRLRALLPLRS